MSLSSKEIKSIKKGLTSLYSLISQKAVKKKEANQKDDYKSYKLQIIELEKNWGDRNGLRTGDYFAPFVI